MPRGKIFSMIEQNKLDGDNFLLKVTIKAETNLKMTLEYSSDQNSMRRLKMDWHDVCML
jgi:hypothetical protein